MTCNNGTVCVRIGSNNKTMLESIVWVLNNEDPPISIVVCKPGEISISGLLCWGLSLRTVMQLVDECKYTSLWGFGTQTIKLFDDLELNIPGKDVRDIAKKIRDEYHKRLLHGNTKKD